MTQFARTKVVLAGFEGAPGVNIMNWCAPAHLDIDQGDVDNFHDILNTALVACSAADVFADAMTWTIDPAVSVHEVDTGELVGAFTDGGGPYTGGGSGSGNESRATQLGIRWYTADFRDGRRVQGRTFLGPLASDALESTGAIKSTFQSSIAAAMSGVIDVLGPRLIIWSRPKPGPVAGQYADVTAVTVAPRPFTLRGRNR